MEKCLGMRCWTFAQDYHLLRQWSMSNTGEMGYHGQGNCVRADVTKSLSDQRIREGLSAGRIG